MSLGQALGVMLRFPFACLLGIVTLIGYPWPASLTWHLRPLLFAGAAALVIWDIRQRYVRPLEASHRKTRIIDLPDEQPEILQRSAAGSDDEHTFDAVQCRIFLYGLLYPNRLRQRLTERYALSPTTLKQSVTIDVHIPEIMLVTAGKGDSPEKEPERVDRVLFPVLVPAKGAMLDDLRVLAADHSDLPALAHREYLQLVARTLRLLMVVAYGGGQLSPATHWWALRAERLALQTILHQADTPPPKEAPGESLRALLSIPPGQNPPIVDRDAIESAVMLVKLLAEHYVVVTSVPCPRDGRMVVAYERLTTRKPTKEASGTHLFRLRPLLSGTAASYHLIVEGPEGVYLIKQGSPGLTDYFGAHWAQIEQENKAAMSAGRLIDSPPPPYYRFGSRKGQRFAHFYTRFAPMPSSPVGYGDNPPNIHLLFRESPPGESFRAAITSSAAAVLIWLVGFVMSRGMLTKVPFTLDSDAPAILLVFPALAATWLGVEQRTQNLIGRTKTTFTTMLVTVFTSIAASGVFMMNNSAITYLAWRNPGNANFLGIQHLPWSLLALAAIVNAIVAIRSWQGHSREYRHLRTRRGSPHTD